MEGRNLYIVMAPLEKRADKKGEGEAAEDAAPHEPGQAPEGGETIGDRLAAKGQAPTATVEPEPAAESGAPVVQLGAPGEDNRTLSPEEQEAVDTALAPAAGAPA